MPDIKTRDTVKGTIKTLDKAAVAGERMKEAYVRTKEKAEQAYILRKAPRRNMRLTVFRAVRKQSLMKPPTSLTSRAAKVFRRPGRTFPRQRSILNSVKLMQNSQKREQDSTAQTLSSMGR